MGFPLKCENEQLKPRSFIRVERLSAGLKQLHAWSEKSKWHPPPLLIFKNRYTGTGMMNASKKTKTKQNKKPTPVLTTAANVACRHYFILLLTSQTLWGLRIFTHREFHLKSNSQITLGELCRSIENFKKTQDVGVGVWINLILMVTIKKCLWYKKVKEGAVPWLLEGLWRVPSVVS